MNTDLHTEAQSRGCVQRSVRHRSIELGALSPKLSQQLKGCRIRPERLRILDKLADSVTWCYLHGLITDAESERARHRLIRKVQEELDRSRTPKVPNARIGDPAQQKYEYDSTASAGFAASGG